MSDSMAYPPNKATSYSVVLTYENPTIGGSGISPVTLGLNHSSVRNDLRIILLIRII